MVEILPLIGRQVAIFHYRSVYKTPKMDQICRTNPVEKKCLFLYANNGSEQYNSFYAISL